MIDELNQYGIARAPWTLSSEQIADIHDHFGKCMAWPAHVVCKVPHYPDGGLTVNEALVNLDWSMFSVRMPDVVACPHLIEQAVLGLNVATQYFGEPARLYSMNAFWTQPSGRMIYGETHDWHRDGDDRKQLGMFIYGTPVWDREDGVHLYEKGTHHEPLGPQLHPVVEENIEMVTGPAGTIFFTNPQGIHMGTRPSRKYRLFMWSRFGVSDVPASYHSDRLSPASRDLIGDRYPTDPAIQRSIELVVR